MARLSERAGKKAVIVKGKFEHISFVYDEKPMPLMILEVVPPHTPKLTDLVEKALDTGRINKPIKAVPFILDLAKSAEASDNQIVMFPCLTEDSSSGKTRGIVRDVRKRSRGASILRPTLEGDAQGVW